MDHGVLGTTMPVLELMLQPGEQVFAESGELAWISMTIQLQTGTAVGGQQGGFMSVPGRAMAGATIFMTQYTAAGGLGMVAFCAKLPGQIMPLEVHPGCGYMERMAKSCRTTSRRETRIHPGHVAMFEDSVDFNVTTMPGIRNPLFGGDGLFLATLTGPAGSGSGR